MLKICLFIQIKCSQVIERALNKSHFQSHFVVAALFTRIRRLPPDIKILTHKTEIIPLAKDSNPCQDHPRWAHICNSNFSFYEAHLRSITVGAVFTKKQATLPIRLYASVKKSKKRKRKTALGAVGEKKIINEIVSSFLIDEVEPWATPRFHDI